MAWEMSGRSMEFCSCTLMCPCWISAEVAPDEGWCSGALAFSVEKGSCDGVDLAGTSVALTADWPGNFFEGKGTGRLYVHAGDGDAQRRELEAIFTGKKGGHLADLFGAVITKWLPTETTQIAIRWDGSPSVRVGSVGEATLIPLKDPSGKATRVTGAVAQAGFQFDGMDLASSKGSRWADPGLRSWEGSSGTLQTFDWRS